MSDTTTNGDGERTSLAPILAPIITLFIGFGAGVVFSEFIPMGKAPVMQSTTGGPASSGPRTDPRSAEQPDQDAEVRKALEDAAAEGDEASQKALDDLTPPAEEADPSDG
jgi:hypothetical protein